MELLEDFPCSNDLLIVKGKRTKRPRPSSSSASSNGGGSSEFGDGGEFCNSTTTSSGISTCTEEDEDMANCLILLSDGGSPPQVEAENKLSSRKLEEMATTTDGKVGIYVYECKTCNRTFPSFQALGGHRASHRRPKISADDTHRKISPPETPTHDLEKETVQSLKNKTTVSSPNTSLFAENSKSKVHVCSICGSEFGSGQALGGHMRRHRSAPTVITNCTEIETHIENDIAAHDVSEKSRTVFDLDLNLPAPSEDDRTENFHRFSSNQQRRLVFSAAVPLVDCHY